VSDIVGRISSSDDGRHIAYIAQNGDVQFMVIDERLGPEYDLIVAGQDGPTWDSAAVVYLAFRGDRLFRVRHSPERNSE
jgi:hypothetical protein